jgi:hypothetical protein
MRTQLIITDLTRMQRGMVCIAGFDPKGCCIRPILSPPGIPENALFDQGEPAIFPSAKVEFFLLRARPQPPHTEDVYFVEGSTRYIERIDYMEEILKKDLYESVRAIFAQPIIHDLGYSVLDCTGPRSIGTLQPGKINQVAYSHEAVNDAWDYRLSFEDPKGETYRLKITDLTWHYYCDSLRAQGETPAGIADKLTDNLKSRTVYLRIGLSRGWKKYPDRCFLQVNGIHTFPDYLEGKIFADFTSQS